MRRTAVRASIPVLLVASFALANTSPAVARPAPSPRWVHEAMRHVPARFALPLRLLPGATTAVGFVGRFRIPGSPYRWGVTAAFLGTHPILAVYGDRSFANGVEEHQWLFQLPPGALRVGPHLREAHVHTDTALGPFGQIDLDFHPGGPIRTHTLRCPSTRDALVSDDLRRGTLTGSLQFASNEGTLPALSVSTMKARAVRETATGAHCPRSPGPVRCRRSRDATVVSQAQGTELAGSVGAGYLIASTYQEVAPAEEVHLILANTAGSRVFEMGPSGLIVDASTLSPLASGSLMFDTASTVRRRGHHCGHVVHQKQVWSSGTLTLPFDSGAVDLTGADLRALVVIHER